MRITDRTNRIALKFAFCALSLLFLLPITRAADAFIKDVSSGCAVFKPNLKPGDAVKFKGSCANGFAHGPGVAMWGASDGTTVTFEGNFVQGKLLGNAKMTASGGDRYQGEYKDGKREGIGAYTSANGDRYDGQYKDNKRDGHGIQTLGTGGRTEGEWRNGTLISKTPNASPSTGLAGPKLGPSQSQVPTVPNEQGRASAAPHTETKGDSLSALGENSMGIRNGGVAQTKPSGKSGLGSPFGLGSSSPFGGNSPVGKWRGSDREFEFFEDGTLTFKEPEGPMSAGTISGKWIKLSDGRLKVDLQAFGMAVPPLLGGIESGQLVLEGELGRIEASRVK